MTQYYYLRRGVPDCFHDVTTSSGEGLRGIFLAGDTSGGTRGTIPADESLRSSTTRPESTNSKTQTDELY